MEPTTKRLVHTFGALADLAQEVADKTDFAEMVLTSLHLLLGALAIRRGAIAEHFPDEQLLRFVAVRGFGEQCPESLSIDSQDRKDIAALGLPTLRWEEASETKSPEVARLLMRWKHPLDVLGIELVVPMVVRGELTGVVLLGAKASGEGFTPDDREIISSMVRHIGVGIHNHRLLEQVEQRADENRRLYEDLRGIYRNTVRAFAAAIDIKDKYTQGHSERVGKYSEIIAREMGWSEEAVEGIAIAGYLHDIGKLVVERDIINAPYKIDAKSSSELNRHPAAGYEILAPIQHPYADIPLMAKYHHERLDGKGYPDGLTDTQIPLGAKIVSLADSFDAMTTDRPYRKRRPLEDVIEDLRRNTGKQFDAEVVLAFCRALLSEIKGETKERRILRMLGKNYIEPELATPLLGDLIAELNSAAFSQAAGSA